MRAKKFEVLSVPVLASHMETIRLIAERRMISVDQLASEILTKELRAQGKLVLALGRTEKRSTQPSQINPPIKLRQKDSFLEKIGIEVRRRRMVLGFSQLDLAKKAGFSRAYISDVENGYRNLGLDNLYQIAAALGVDGSFLVHKAEFDGAEPLPQAETG